MSDENLLEDDVLGYLSVRPRSRLKSIRGGLSIFYPDITISSIVTILRKLEAEGKVDIDRSFKTHKYSSRISVDSYAEKMEDLEKIVQKYTRNHPGCSSQDIASCLEASGAHLNNYELSMFCRGLHQKGLVESKIMSNSIAQYYVAKRKS